MKFLKIILIILLVLGAVFFIGAFLLPSEVKVERTTEINAPASVVYYNVIDFHNWDKWSPWFQIDKDMKKKYEGKPGIGHAFIWKSDVEEAGAGSMEILAAEKFNKINMKLSFDGAESALSNWTFTEKDGKTIVQWDFKSELDYWHRWMGFLMDSWLGDDYEKGLAELKKFSEANSSKPKMQMSVKEIPSQKVLIIHDSTENIHQIHAKLGEIYQEVMTFMQKASIPFTAPPVAITKSWTDKGTWNFQAGFPFDTENVVPEGRVQIVQIPGGLVCKTIYIGSYDGIEDCYHQIMTYISENNFEIVGDSWEQYFSDPQKTKPEDLETHIFFPVKEKNEAVSGNAKKPD